MKPSASFLTHLCFSGEPGIRVSQDWIPGIAKHLKKTRSLCEVFGGTSLEKMIQDLPEDLRKVPDDLVGGIWEVIDDISKHFPHFLVSHISIRRLL